MAALVTMLALVWAAPASAATGPVVSASSGRCLDVSGGSATNGAQAQIWDCNGQANQQWTTTSATELRVFSNKCLDVNGAATADGSTVIIWDCNGQNNQKWRLNSDGSITAVGANKCLDVPNNATANGTKLVIWTCNGGANQRWTISGTNPSPSPSPSASPSASPSPSPSSTSRFSNPVLWEDLADIDIFRVDNTYYYSASTMHYS
ncbi:lectin, partial [Microbispora sp. NPDC049125]|uniref:RICIN domain-containing protein n=1 Tax=Microbispora sp. NPDC049125 TaxID=3154929 RepID=UPI0034672723